MIDLVLCGDYIPIGWERLVRKRVAVSLGESGELETMPYEWKWQPGGQQFGAGAGADRQHYFNTLSRLNVDQQSGGSIGRRALRQLPSTPARRVAPRAQGAPTRATLRSLEARHSHPSGRAPARPRARAKPKHRTRRRPPRPRHPVLGFVRSAKSMCLPEDRQKAAGRAKAFYTQTAAGLQLHNDE